MRRRLAAVLAASAVLLGLTACAPAARPATTATPAAADAFRCPSATDVAALTAVPFAASRSAGAACAYASAQLGRRAVVTVTHTATTATLAADRALQLSRDAGAIADTRSVAFDAFEVRSPNGCVAWQYATDGGVMATSAQGADLTAATACGIARSVGVLAGTAASGAVTAPIVSVIAPAALAGPSGRTQRWASVVGLERDVRVDVVPSCGRGVTPVGKGGADYGTCAGAVSPSSAAVVVVASTADAADASAVGGSLRATITAIRVAAPRARVLVVAPGAAGADDATTALSATVASAARSAGATVLDPIAGEWDADAAGTADGGVSATTQALITHIGSALGGLHS